MDAVSLHTSPEYHQPRRGRHIPAGPGATGFALERWSLLGAQEFSLLAGVDGGVHVVRVVPGLVPARLVGGFGHDGLVALAGHQGAVEKKQEQDWESCGDHLLEGRWAISAGSYFPSRQQPIQNWQNIAKPASSLFKPVFDYKEKPLYTP